MAQTGKLKPSFQSFKSTFQECEYRTEFQVAVAVAVTVTVTVTEVSLALPCLRLEMLSGTVRLNHFCE
jgi:hypothetical protein